MSQLHAIIHGRVQGVSFRYYTQLQAQSLGITGWVRNMPNGTVETVAVGDQKKLEYFFAWLHHGPSAATVTQVDADWDNTSPKFAAFEIQHDAK